MRKVAIVGAGMTKFHLFYGIRIFDRKNVGEKT